MLPCFQLHLFSQRILSDLRLLSERKALMHIPADTLRGAVHCCHQKVPAMDATMHRSTHSAVYSLAELWWEKKGAN